MSGPDDSAAREARRVLMLGGLQLLVVGAGGGCGAAQHFQTTALVWAAIGVCIVAGGVSRVLSKQMHHASTDPLRVFLLVALVGGLVIAGGLGVLGRAELVSGAWVELVKNVAVGVCVASFWGVGSVQHSGGF